MFIFIVNFTIVLHPRDAYIKIYPEQLAQFTGNTRRKFYREPISFSFFFLSPNTNSFGIQIASHCY